MFIISCKLINVTLPYEIVKNVSSVLMLDVLNVLVCWTQHHTALLQKL